MRVSDVVRASDDDLAWLFDGWSVDQVAERWLDMGAAAVVITGGGNDATCFTQTGTTRVEGESVSVIDTIGAGDTFSAGLIDALWAGGLLGAQSRERLGADPPRLAELHPDWRTDVLPARSASDRHNPDNEMSGSPGRRSQP